MNSQTSTSLVQYKLLSAIGSNTYLFSSASFNYACSF